MGDEERRFKIRLEEHARIAVRRQRDPEKGLDWAAVLLVKRDGRYRTVCVYDNAHGQPERHGFREGVKLEAEPVSSKGSARRDLPAAIDEIKANWEGMVELWER